MRCRAIVLSLLSPFFAGLAFADAPEQPEIVPQPGLTLSSDADLESWMRQTNTLDYAAQKIRPMAQVSPAARLEQLELRWELTRDHVRRTDNVWADRLEREIQDLRVVIGALQKRRLSRRQLRPLMKRLERLERSIEFAKRIRAVPDFAQA